MWETIQRCIDAVQDERRVLCERLQELILELDPRIRVTPSYKIPTYGGSSGWLALDYWKNGVSLYTSGAHNIEAFKACFPRIKSGKGSINFKMGHEVPEEAVKSEIGCAVDSSGSTLWHPSCASCRPCP